MSGVTGRISLALAAIAFTLHASTPSLAAQDSVDRRIEQFLRRTPLIDGHNDLPWQIRQEYDSWRKPLELRRDTSSLPAPLQTDLPRLRRGHMGAQFWSAYVPVSFTGAEAVLATIEQIDIIHQMARRYPDILEMAGSAADIKRIHKAGRVASLIGVEGGHQIGNSLSVLRQYYALGVRYMTLTHSANNDWADSATAAPLHHGLTPFGRDVIREMNRIGMIIDLSHVSPETMRGALDLTKSPVIFSHSDARAINDHPRNVPDEILRLLPANGGVVMVNFYPDFISGEYRIWAAARTAERARQASLLIGQPDQAEAAMKAWEQAHPAPVTSIGQVADHIDHIRKVAGAGHIGIGGDLDGMSGTSIEGLGGVDRYPFLFRELIRRGWTDDDLAKLAGGNLLRAMAKVEQVAADLSADPPILTAP